MINVSLIKPILRILVSSYKIFFQRLLYKLSNKQWILIHFLPFFMMNHIQMLITIILNKLILHFFRFSNLLGPIYITINVMIRSIQVNNHWIRKPFLRRNPLKYLRLLNIPPLLLCNILPLNHTRIINIHIFKRKILLMLLTMYYHIIFKHPNKCILVINIPIIIQLSSEYCLKYRC